MNDILTAVEVAAMLRLSRRHVCELTKPRTASGDLREHPLPVIRFGSSLRFRKADVEAWIETLATKKKE